MATVAKVFKDGSAPTMSFSRQLLAVWQKQFFPLLEVMVSMCVGCMCINSVVLLSSYFAGTIWRQLRSVVPQGLLWKQCHGKSSEGTAACCYLSERRTDSTCLGVASGFSTLIIFAQRLGKLD